MSVAFNKKVKKIETEEEVEVEGSHVFEWITFNKPTYCTSCKGMLWGVHKQGLQCKCML